MNKKHCDEYIEDLSQPECLRVFLNYARSPAHGSQQAKPAPRLFATYGLRRVRVTMASRFGDVGINKKLHEEYGYDKRVFLCDLKDFNGDT